MAADPADLGRRLARRLTAGGARPRARELAAQMGIQMLEEERPPAAQPRLRSEYRAGPPRIILYRKTIDFLAAARRDDGVSGEAEFDLDEVHVAHELFHHLERAEGLGPLTGAESEEAAHAFARELLGLPFDPRELSELGR